MYYIIKKAQFFISLKISAQGVLANQSFNQCLLFSSLFLSLHFYSQTDHPRISAASLWIATLVVLNTGRKKSVIQLSATSRFS